MNPLDHGFIDGFHNPWFIMEYPPDLIWQFFKYVADELHVKDHVFLKITQDLTTTWAFGECVWSPDLQIALIKSRVYNPFVVAHEIRHAYQWKNKLLTSINNRRYWRGVFINPKYSTQHEFELRPDEYDALQFAAQITQRWNDTHEDKFYGRHGINVLSETSWELGE